VQSAGDLQAFTNVVRAYVVKPNVTHVTLPNALRSWVGHVDCTRARTANRKLRKVQNVGLGIGFQFFNVFNHPVLDIPNASGARCVDCSTGGVITNIDANVPMRQLQFAFRVEF